MAGIRDILETERSRATCDDWRKIHLFQEGSFYRAYEASAWLCHRYISQFRVTHRHVKGIEQSIAFVGFPVTGLEKRVPEGAHVEEVGEKHLALVLPSTCVSGDADAQVDAFGEWKQQQPMSEAKKTDEDKDRGKKRLDPDSETMPQSLSAIVRQVLSYPVESRSPIDCMLFLSEVKRNIAQITRFQTQTDITKDARQHAEELANSPAACHAGESSLCEK
mgnify:CR=1 FL=1